LIPDELKARLREIPLPTDYDIQLAFDDDEDA
jgi:hypothetical protein